MRTVTPIPGEQPAADDLAESRRSCSVKTFHRGHRLRRTRNLRMLFQESHVRIDDVVCPLFVSEALKTPRPVQGMPGICQIPESALEAEIDRLSKLRIKSIMLFAVAAHKDGTGECSLDPTGVLSRVIRTAKSTNPDLVVMADNCFCEFTEHGNCGIVVGDQIQNDLTLANLGRQAVVCAQAGADVICPSGMIDGQVVGIREALDANGFPDTPVMAYAAKFASCYYGPFRDAAGVSFKGERTTYQVNPANGREAILECMADAAEGADILMIKPGLMYLDIIARLRDRLDLPLAAYQVSGEYAMIQMAAERGVFTLEKAVMESMLAFKRAGADIVVTYFAETIANMFRGTGG